MNILLVESCEAAANAGAYASGAKIVALSPDAAYELERRGISFSIEDDYCEQRALDDLGVRNCERLEALVRWMDDFLAERSTVLQEHRLRLASFHFLQLKIMLDVASLRLYTLRRILEAEAPSAVWFWRNGCPDHLTRTLFFPYNDSLYARIAPLLCQHMGIDWKVSSPSLNRAGKSGHSSWRVRLGPWIRSGLPSIPHLPANLVRGSGKGTTVTLDRVLFLDLLKTGRADLLYWDVHTTSRILAWPVPLSGWNRKSTALIVRRFVEEMNSLRPELAVQPEFRRHLTWWDTNLTPILQSRFQYYVTSMLPEALSVYLQSSAMFQRLQPAVLLSQDYSDYRRRAAAQAARDLGIPVVTVQHGGYGWFLWSPIYYSDLAPSDYLLAWGEGVREHVLNRHLPSRDLPSRDRKGAVIVPVGSLALDALMRHSSRTNRERLCKQLGLDPRAKTVVYCLTNMAGNVRYLDSVICSDHKRFAIQRAMVQVFREFPETQFVIKLHPSPSFPGGPIVRLLKDEGVRNCLPIKHVPFSDLLPLAHLVIIDSPTTTLLQALAAGKKVLIFNDFFRWEQGALELLQPAAVVSSDWQEFAGLLRRELSNLDQPYVSDQEFLKHFGTYQNDGKSGERLLKALASIAARTEEASKAEYETSSAAV